MAETLEFFISMMEVIRLHYELVSHMKAQNSGRFEIKISLQAPLCIDFNGSRKSNLAANIPLATSAFCLQSSLNTEHIFMLAFFFSSKFKMALILNFKFPLKLIQELE